MNSANNLVQIGLIGAGNIGNVHIETFQKTGGCQVAGITDAAPNAAKARAEQHGIERVYESAEAMLADERIDAVIIAAPNAFHGPLAVQALEAGKHVMLEKPMALDAEAARSIMRAHRNASDRVLMLSHQMRWEPAALQAKRMLDEGGLGDVYAAKAGWYRRKGIPGWGTWFTRKELSGGGALIDIGVHLLDLSLHLMGNPKPVSVSGATYAAFGPGKRGIGNWGTPDWNGEFNVDDLASAFVRMENGSSFSLDVSWAVNGVIEESGPFLHLFGDKAGVTIRGGQQGRWFRETDGELEDGDLLAGVESTDARILMSRHFLDCIREGKQPITHGMSGLTNSLVLEAIYESSRTGREVVIDYSF